MLLLWSFVLLSPFGIVADDAFATVVSVIDFVCIAVAFTISVTLLYLFIV